MFKYALSNIIPPHIHAEMMNSIEKMCLDSGPGCSFINFQENCSSEVLEGSGVNGTNFTVDCIHENSYHVGFACRLGVDSGNNFGVHDGDGGICYIAESYPIIGTTIPTNKTTTEQL